MVSVRDAPGGPLTSWIPPCGSPSPIPPSSGENEPPTSLWKRGGAAVGGIYSVLAGALFFEPTSHKRGGVTCQVVVCV